MEKKKQIGNPTSEASLGDQLLPPISNALKRKLADELEKPPIPSSALGSFIRDKLLKIVGRYRI
ncbi:MAG: hypothetical protein JNJ49_04165 [Bdellovibrionaceae bacterium]|nr:hypothetical protein [Pseudobdellovibrionaceae bacterium]